MNAVTQLARTLGLRVVAEGVETEAQIRLLVPGGLRLFTGLPLRTAPASPPLPPARHRTGGLITDDAVGRRRQRPVSPSPMWRVVRCSTVCAFPMLRSFRTRAARTKATTMHPVAMR